MEELAVIDGLGAKKVKDIYFTFHKPFKAKPRVADVAEPSGEGE